MAGTERGSRCARPNLGGRLAGLSKSSKTKAAANPSGHNTRNAVIALAVAGIPHVLNFVKKRNSQTHTAAATAAATATEGASVKKAF